MRGQHGFTILTEPLDFKGRIKENMKYCVGRHRQYGGHSTVTRGLIEGLDKLGYMEYNYRPKEKDIYSTVHVLSGVKTLQYAIELKKQGKIKNLSVGPNVVVFSTDYEGLIANEMVDLCLTPSSWVSHDYVKRTPSLKDRITEWPVGVNMDKFFPTKPFEQRDSKRVLIYHKNESDQMCWYIEYILRECGYRPIIIKCGFYSLEEYKKLLEDAEFMVVISDSESQGIFMLEAWSMDVPTICFDRHFHKWPGTEIVIAGDISSCPYLEKENGIRFAEIGELKEILDHWPEIKKNMHPREWCQTHMSDVICAKKFIDILNINFQI